MSQTNTNTNNGQNWNHISGRGGQGQEAPNDSGRGDCHNSRGNNSIVIYSFERKMKEGLISKLTITETEHRPSQFKEISDVLSVLYADKKYQGLNEVLHIRRDRVETDFMPAYPDANQWSIFYQVQIITVKPEANTEPDGSRLVLFQTIEQNHVTDANLKKELL